MAHGCKGPGSQQLYDGHDSGDQGGHAPDPDAGGIVGGCQDFNGTSEWIDIPDHADLDWASDSSFTIELWANFTNVASRNKVMIGRDQGGGNPHWWLGGQQNTGLVVFNLLDTGNNGVACTGATAVNDGNWHHIVAVRDESTNQNRIYVERIARRVDELSLEHPEHKEAFERYLDRERKESAFIEDHLTYATWLLRRN